MTRYVACHFNVFRVDKTIIRYDDSGPKYSRIVTYHQSENIKHKIIGAVPLHDLRSTLGEVGRARAPRAP